MSIKNFEFNAEDFIEHEDVHVVLSQNGWIRKLKTISDPSSLKFKENDQLLGTTPCNTKDLLGLFTSFGIGYVVKVYNLPSTRSGFGEPIQSLFNFADGEKVIADPQVLRRALTYALTFNLLIIQHPEDPSLASGVMNSGEMSTRLGLPGIPTVAETIIVERDIRLVELTGGKIHFANVSTKDAIEAIRKAKSKGLKITCDTAPPYFSLNENSVGEYRTFAKLSPPLRNEQDRLSVVEALQDGTIDLIASGHAPQDEDSKRLPFAQAAYGGVGLETLLPVCLELYHNGHMSLLECLSKITSGPAHLLGLPAGQLIKGQRADLTLFDPDEGWLVQADNLASKAKNTPFDGRPVQGTVLRTVIDGRAVYQSSKLS